MFEMALHEWGKDHVYICEHWTESQFKLMIDRLMERKCGPPKTIASAAEDRGFIDPRLNM
jgi:hypothetical protein